MTERPKWDPATGRPPDVKEGEVVNIIPRKEISEDGRRKVWVRIGNDTMVEGFMRTVPLVVDEVFIPARNYTIRFDPRGEDET